MNIVATRLPLAIAATLTLSMAGAAPALAFHPFDDLYGYRPPVKRADPAETARGTARGQASRSQPRGNSARANLQPAARSASSLWFEDDEDDAASTASPPSRRQPITRTPVLDGGGRPAIAATAPPVVRFPNNHGTGTIVIDTGGRALYYVLSSTSAYRYPISVGRVGFTWTGTERVSRVASWPDWRPPAEMKERQPGLPDLMTGGVRNPLGAKALYLGNSLYRIHGTNDTTTIGQAASSGCFRMMNSHVTHLAGLARVGTIVKVMSRVPTAIASRADTARGG